MDIAFNCDKCGQRIEIDGAGEGLIVPCPTCRVNLIVPKAEDAECIQIEDGKRSICYPSQIRLPSIGEQVEFRVEKDGKARFLNSEKLHFYGQCSYSPDRRYILVWEESGFHPFTGKRK